MCFVSLISKLRYPFPYVNSLRLHTVLPCTFASQRMDFSLSDLENLVEYANLFLVDYMNCNIVIGKIVIYDGDTFVPSGCPILSPIACLLSRKLLVFCNLIVCSSTFLVVVYSQQIMGIIFRLAIENVVPNHGLSPNCIYYLLRFYYDIIVT